MAGRAPLNHKEGRPRTEFTGEGDEDVKRPVTPILLLPFGIWLIVKGFF